MATRMQQRRGTAAQWTAANPVLAAGEIGFETDTNKFKMGNGSSAWTALQYFANAAELAAIIDGAPDLLNTLNELAAAIGDDPAFFTNIGNSIADNIDSHNVAIDVHGIANTALLATLTNVSTAQTAAEGFATTAVTNHSNDTTGVHGIDDTAALARTTDVTTAIGNAVTGHSSDTTDVHGIANTALLATQAYADSAVSTHSTDTTEVHGITNTADLATMTYADTAVSTHSDDTTDVHGIENTVDLATKTYADTAVSTHAALTEDVHGIADVSLLATQDYVDTAVGNSSVDQSLLAGVGIDYNTDTDQFDIDSTVATKTYADGAVSTAVTSLTKSSVGLANVDNTSDANKPVSTATQTELDLKAPLADPTFTGTVSGITKSHVGLGNVDNTADSAKPVSTATQTALDLKAPLAGPSFTGDANFDGSVTIEGNLVVEGTTTTVNTSEVQIDDPLFYLAANQYDTNTRDIGITGAYGTVGGTEENHLHTGLVKDVTDGKWKLFSNTPHPVNNVVDFTSADYDTLKVGSLEATTVTPSSGVVFSDGTQTKEGVPSRTYIYGTANSNGKSASYTLSLLAERDSMIEFDSASAMTLTIPADSTVNYPIGTTIDILQTNTGQVTVAAAGGVTANATPGLKLRTRWSSATLMKRAANTWVVYGDLTA
jgi:hypothetical protein